MNDIFKKEWNLYSKSGEADVRFRGTEKRVWPKGFDGPVKPGEILVFADMNRPLTALVLEARGAAGYRIVPVSPFTVPASARELLVGERVFQLWNACTAAKDFTERSWLVATLDSADVDEIAKAAEKVPPGARSEDETARAYERAFEVPGGNFRPLTDGAFRARKIRWNPRWIQRAAALLALCCGLGVLWHATRQQDDDMKYNVPSSESVSEDKAISRREIPSAEEIGFVQAPCAAADAAPPARKPEPPPSAQAPAAAKAKSMPPGPLKKRGIRSRPLLAQTRMPLPDGMILELEEDAEFDAKPDAQRERKVADGTERYAEFEENEFLSPLSEPLSTFGLDVDTSSYALTRNSLTEQKRLPPKNSVRIEEFINYFTYDYAPPADGAPVAVACEMAPCPWNTKHDLLRIGVRAKTVEEENLPPCNLTFLIDVSGSMEWNDGLSMARQGLKMLVEKLRDEDHVAIVTYADGTAVRLPSVSGREKATIRGVIDGLRAGGGTAGGAGIQLAYEEAKKNFDRKSNNRVILVTDGDFNIGISSPKDLEDFIAEKRESGVFLTVLGVGRGNTQDANMKKLANAGNGNYAFLDTALEAKRVMMNEFGGTMATVAKDVKIQVEFNPAKVEGYRLLGYENRALQAKDFNDDKKDAGEIGSGHTMTAFYEIIPAGSGEMGAGTDPLKYQKRETSESEELVTVKTRYKEPGGDTSLLAEKAYSQERLGAAATSEDFRFASAVAEFALLLNGSKYKGEASFAKLIERARDAKGADREGYRAEFIRLAELAELYSTETIYTVRSGDSLWSIARDHGISVEALKAANKDRLRGDVIRESQELVVPAREPGQ